MKTLTQAVHGFLTEAKNGALINYYVEYHEATVQEIRRANEGRSKLPFEMRKGSPVITEDINIV